MEKIDQAISNIKWRKKLFEKQLEGAITTRQSHNIKGLIQGIDLCIAILEASLK